MAINRIHQLNQTIYDLRLRGLSERQEIRELRKAVSDHKNALEAAQAEIQVLTALCRKESTGSVSGVICFDARQYEALCVSRAQEKGKALENLPERISRLSWPSSLDGDKPC